MQDKQPVPSGLRGRLLADLPLTLISREIRSVHYSGISAADEQSRIQNPERKSFVLNCGFARTPGNRFWASWGAGEDGPRGSLLIAYSDDEGRTWNPRAFALDGGDTPHGIHLTNRVGALWCDPCGCLHLFFIQTLNYFDGRSGCWESVCVNPDDAAPKWSVPVRIGNGTPINKPCVRADGEWLLPVSLSIRRHAKFDGEPLPDDMFAELDDTRGANVLASRDNGKHWEYRGFQRSTDPLFDEHHILERRDGSLRMYARDTFGIVSADSRDGGFHWTPFKREWFTASARFFVTVLPSGSWLMVRHDTEKADERKNLTAFLSLDEGKTWKCRLLLDERERISYPDGFAHPDGRIFIQYDHLRENGSLTMAVFTEQDVAAGGNVSGKVILKTETIH